jgi:hypothetical protein
MVKLYFGLALLDDSGFMDFDDDILRTFCVAAEDKTYALTKIRNCFKQACGQYPERVCLREISEVDGYFVILEPKSGRG